MDDFAGIDLGTTNSLIGVMEYGFPMLIADENGKRITPSVVHFDDADSPIVGEPAQRARTIAPDRTVYSVKRLIGLTYRQAENEVVDYKIIAGERGRAAVRIGDRVFSPEEISSLILRKLKLDAERTLGRPILRAVITVPAYFNDVQRSATKRAGELAGFAVERILNEPTAAALAYGIDRTNRDAHIAVYDLGGGTFDISILRLRDDIFEVLATNGNTHLGGDDIDAALMRYLQSKLERTIADRARLREAVVEAKHRLSEQEEVLVRLPFTEGRNIEVSLSRAELEKLSRPIIDRTRWHCARALADSGVQLQGIDELILVGGATRMPLVRRAVREIFQREPNTSQNPEEAVALGAIIQAGILSGASQGVVLLDVTPLSLGIETFGGLMNVIIPRNSTIPTKAGEMFTTAVNNQKSMLIKVLQGEREMARDNWLLGQFEIEFEPAPKGVPRVGVQFEIDANGILRVLARDTKTGLQRQVSINSAVDVSDEAVEKALSDSLEHAFDDMSERAWTEARLKAEEMLSALGEALAIAGEELSPAEGEMIETARQEVERAIGDKNLKQLQEASARLDATTQNLAAIVLQRAASANS